MVNTGPRSLRNGRMVSGAIPKYKQPNIGGMFGELTVLSMDFGPRGGIKSVKCRCSCGRITYPHRDNLVAGKSTRCNVCAKKASAATNTKYKFLEREDRNRLVNRVCAIISRCETRPHPRYGQRGIRVYPKWIRDRGSFLKYLISLPGWDDPNLEIDRINTNGNYEPGNLRFVTRTENMQNLGH